MTSLITRLQRLTLEEAAKELGVTQVQVLRLVEEEHLRLYVRTSPHGIHHNWCVSNWSPADGYLTGIQQISCEYASKLLSNLNGLVEVKAVVLGDDGIERDLSKSGSRWYPTITIEDVYIDREDIRKCMIGINQTRALDESAVGSDSTPDQQEGRQSSKQEERKPELEPQTQTKGSRGDYLDFLLGEFLDEKTNWSKASCFAFMATKGAKFISKKMTWTDPTGKSHEWPMKTVENRLSIMKVKRGGAKSLIPP